MKKLFAVFWNHLPVALYSFFWAGIFIGGIFAPQERIDLLDSSYLTKGYQISIISCILMWPFIIAYFIRFKHTSGKHN